MTLEKKINEIFERNKRVEIDKAWETSKTRRIIITAITYVILAYFFVLAELPNPFVNALVPTGAFVISTLSLPFLKKWWINNIYKRGK